MVIIVVNNILILRANYHFYKTAKKSSLQKSQESYVCNEINSPPASVWVVPILSSFERECIFSTGLILFIPACCEFLKFYKLIINMVIVGMMINESQCFESQWWRCVSYSDCGRPSLRFQLIGREGLTHSTLELSDSTQLMFWNFQNLLYSRSESRTLVNCLDLKLSDPNHAEGQF